MPHRLAILLLILSTSLSLKAQTLLTGRVVSEPLHKPLARVSVVAEDKDQKPVAYALTKSDGMFTLKVAEGKTFNTLTFSLLGYGKRLFTVTQFKNGQTVVMKEEQYQLKEVEIKSQRLRQRSDTLSYSVSGFRQKQDRSIADVIAKMPGLEVEGNGTIKYQGKAINHFYIEDMDLMGKQYAMASENISAMKVKEVQVLQNHQDIKTLQGAQFSDRAALNLILEDDAQGMWMGQIEVGLGTTMQETDADRLLRNGRLMGMMFSGKTQNLSMYKWNNTGKSIKNEVRDLTDNDRTNDDMLRLTPDISLDAPDLLEYRYLMNDSHLLATNLLCQTGKDASIRLQMSGILDQTKGRRSTQTIYSKALDGTTITETEQGKANTSEWKGELEYKLNGSHLYVSNVAGGYIDFNSSWAETLLNGTACRQEARPHKWRINDDLQIVKSLGNNKSLQFKGFALYSYQPGTLLLADMTTQHIDQHTTEANIELTFWHKLFNRLNVSYLSGADYSRQQFSLWRDGMDRQEDSYSQQSAHVKPSVSGRVGSLNWSASVDLRLVGRHFRDNTDVRVVAEPFTSISYKMTAKLQGKVSYFYKWTPSSLANMSEIPLFRNYRNYTTGTGSFFESGKHWGVIRLEYTDPVHGLFGFLDSKLIYIDKSPVYNSSLDGVMYHREATGTYSSRDTWILKGRVSKSLGSMKFLMALNGDLQWSHYVTTMQGQQQKFRNDVYQIGIYFSLRPLYLLSIEEKSQFLYNKQVCSANRSLDSPVLRSFKHTIKLFLTPGKWQLGWIHDISHSNDNSVSSNYFSDLEVSYRTKTYEIGISFDNIFGNRNYERQLTQADATLYIQNSLRPREIIFKGSFNF